MGASQSNQEQSSTTTHGITVVHASPSREAFEDRVSLPPRAPPILSVNGYEIDTTRHKPEVQLNHRHWVNVVATIDKFAYSRADLIATRQSQLQEKVILVDNYIQRFTDSYITNEHKALARMNEDCKQVDEMSKQFDKCIIRSELCVEMLNKLNSLLPQEQRLESLER